VSEECRSCGAPIDWAQPVDPTKKAQPVDHASAGREGGRLAVWRDKQGVLRFHHISKANPLKPGEILGTSHWGTCKQAAQWRGHGRQDPASPARTVTPGEEQWPAGRNGEAANR
jgi:hypothetical protein